MKYGRIIIAMLIIAMLSAMVGYASAQDDDAEDPAPPIEESEEAGEIEDGIIVDEVQEIEEPAPPAPEEIAETYTVQRGDTLFRIAQRFNMTTAELARLNNITNASLIFAGQVLQVSASAEPPTPPPDEPRVHIVQRGDILARIAATYNTTVSAILAANNIPNPNVIFVGQRLVIPAPDAEEVTEVVDEAPEEDATDIEPIDVVEEEAVIDEIAEVPQTLPAASFGYGVEVYFDGQDAAQLVGQLEQTPMTWVRVRVDWRVVEPERDQYQFDGLDAIVSTLQQAGVDILFTITNAPAWARTSPDENGPPDDLNDFFRFVETVVERYTGQISAYQIWDEPNLRRNWNCERRMCDTDYLFMLGESFTVIRNADPDAQIISAGLAPTRFNDRVNAVDDRLYMETLLSRGLGTVVDGIGIHPGGEANPPDAECCEAGVGIDSHYENEVFYFRENLTAYRALIERFGYPDVPLWVTKFGWGTGEDTTPPANPNQPHFSVNYTSLTEQAVYIPRAFELGQELGYIGPMFLHNFNGCAITEAGGLPELCFFSLIGPDGQPRPAFTAVQGITPAAVSP